MTMVMELAVTNPDPAHDDRQYIVTQAEQAVAEQHRDTGMQEFPHQVPEGREQITDAKAKLLV